MIFDFKKVLRIKLSQECLDCNKDQLCNKHEQYYKMLIEVNIQ